MADITKKQKKLLSFFYTLVTVLLNIVVVLVVTSIHFPVSETHEYEVWMDFVNAHELLGTLSYIVSFAIPLLWSSRHRESAPKNKGVPEAERFKRDTLNQPWKSAMISVAGWGFIFLFQFILTVYVHISTGVPVYSCLKTSALFTVLGWILVFSCTFLILETVNRAKIVPTFFPEEKIASTKNAIKPSITFTFLMYYIGAGIFPVIVLIFSTITEAQNTGADVNWTLITIILLFLLLGIFLTLLLAHLFRKPLRELSFVAEKISQGDYKVRVKVVSADEIGTLGETFNEMSKSLAEKEFMNDVFGKIVTPDVRDHLLGGGMGGIALGGENMNVTILFCDIRGFTTLSEKLEPEKIVQILNYYFTSMADCITCHHGIINKYIGDAIMAIFGAPVKSQNHARDAYLAALEMRAALASVNEEFAKRGFPAIRFGIGIHTGTVLAGNIGSASRMEYTVIGDSVNVASRIEGLCKEYKRDLLISESAVKSMVIAANKDDSAEGATPADGTTVAFGGAASGGSSGAGAALGGAVGANASVGAASGGSSGACAALGAGKVPMPEFLAESPIRGKEEKIKLYTN